MTIHVRLQPSRADGRPIGHMRRQPNMVIGSSGPDCLREARDGRAHVLVDLEEAVESKSLFLAVEDAQAADDARDARVVVAGTEDPPAFRRLLVRPLRDGVRDVGGVVGVPVGRVVRLLDLLVFQAK